MSAPDGVVISRTSPQHATYTRVFALLGLVAPGFESSSVDRAVSGDVEATFDGKTVDGLLQAIVYVCSKKNAASMVGTPATFAAVEQWFTSTSKVVEAMTETGSKLEATRWFHDLNQILTDRIFVVGGALSVVDIYAFAVVAATIREMWIIDLQTTPHLTRWFKHLYKILKAESVVGSVRIFNRYVHTPAGKRVTAASVVTGFIEASNEKLRLEKEANKKKKGSGRETSSPVAQPATAPATPAQKGKQAGGDGSTQATDAAKDDKKKAKEAKKAAREANKAARGGDKAAAPPAAENIERMDFRIGRIVDVGQHPEADGLYVEKVDLGEESGPRTIVSGLVKHVPIDRMRGAMVLVLANLKPSKLRGIVSQGMVLCASKDNKEHLELMVPPSGSEPGDLVTVEGFNRIPDAILPPKKKIWEAVMPDMKVGAGLVGGYEGHALVTPKGKVCATLPVMEGGNIA